MVTITKKHDKIFALGFILLLAAFVFTMPGLTSKAKHVIRLINYHWLQNGAVAGSSVYELPAGWHRQEHSLSCEIAALKMALAYYGAVIPESELIQHLRFDPTPRTNNTWGDPYTGFVGNIDGKMFRDGYGVYWQPVADVGSKFRKTEIKQFSKAADLAEEISLNRPVVIWGYFGNGSKGSWTTPDGRIIEAVNGEHARTAIGFMGPVKAPTHFIMLDPIYGRLVWEAQDVMDNWAPFDHHGVVVLPDAPYVKTSLDSTIWKISEDGTKRHPMVMAWDEFLGQGGHGQSIATVSQEELERYIPGSAIRLD